MSRSCCMEKYEGMAAWPEPLRDGGPPMGETRRCVGEGASVTMRTRGASSRVSVDWSCRYLFDDLRLISKHMKAPVTRDGREVLGCVFQSQNEIVYSMKERL